MNKQDMPANYTFNILIETSSTKKDFLKTELELASHIHHKLKVCAMNNENESRSYKFAKGDFIQQTGSFVTGVDESTRSNKYDVKQARAVGSTSQNVVFDKQNWCQSATELREFLLHLRQELFRLSLTREALDFATAKILDIEAKINSDKPNIGIMQASGNVLHGILLGVGGNLATKLLRLLTGLNL